MIQPSMMLITSNFGQQKTFRMIPVTTDCPYAECIWDSINKVFVILHKYKKEGFHMVEQLDSNGDPVLSLKGRANGSRYKEERKLLTTSHESYIIEKEEAISMIEMFAVNAKTYDYKKHMEGSNIIQTEPSIITNI